MALIGGPVPRYNYGTLTNLLQDADEQCRAPLFLYLAHELAAEKPASEGVWGGSGEFVFCLSV